MSGPLVYEWATKLERDVVFHAVVEEHTDLMAEGRTILEARDALVSLWNEQRPQDPRGALDFTWRNRPVGWVRPPQNPTRGTVITSSRAPMVFDGAAWVRVDDVVTQRDALQKELREVHAALAFEGDLYDLKKPDLLELVKRVRAVLKEDVWQAIPPDGPPQPPEAMSVV